MRQTLVMPKVGESVTEGTVLRWLKSDGDQVKVDDSLVEVETEKVNVEIPSQWAGVLRVAAQEGDTVKVGEPLAYIETEAGTDTKASGPAPTPVAAATPVAVGPAVASPVKSEEPKRDGRGPGPRYSPVVQILAREHDIDLTLVRGTGLEGRVTRKDVLAYIAEREKQPAVTVPAPSTQPAAVGAAEEVVPLTAMRRTIAERMLRSVQTAPHAWLMVEVDVTPLVRWRQQIRDEFRDREGVDLTYLPFAVQATVHALKEHPIVNSSWSDRGIVLKKEINVGVAVATDEGLIVPVVRGADALSIAGLARQIADVTERARARKLRIEDVEGGTFTLDNTGPLGSVISMPIISPPQAGILTLEAIVPRPVVIDDAIAIRQMVNMCFSFDHRVMDGAQAGAFLGAVKARMQAFGPETSLY